MNSDSRDSIQVERYTPEDRWSWDDLVRRSKNGTFLFMRDYMDYHADRFPDSSLLIYRKGLLDAVLPGSLTGDVYRSHPGLTYGGLVMSDKLAAVDVLAAFGRINEKLKELGAKTVVYKAIPHIYHQLPSGEDLYALFRLKAEKIGCHLSSAVFQGNKLKFSESRKCGIRKSRRENVVIRHSTDFESMWAILRDHLQRKFGVAPVHSASEMDLLHSRFPEQIHLYLAEMGGAAVAGTVVFAMKSVAHVQYIAASDTGRAVGALDLLFDELINREFRDIPVFDFGHSNEDMGRHLNEPLIFQKEGFGGRGITYDIYQYGL